ncbi:putative methyltransferase [Clostridium botulinum H04402 065]|uniref:class I SAM-dependent methyltransferase n=1 Tax=Clostridium botulinum TaxID=1491 RepID=UPI0001F84D10|nr:class I SAM-dependent methyltransferase [Clostridium botulinum]NFC49139.1 class I SAM-dependent methyltransferase [Clostridium botulinum]NFC93082.1 class I SAM-dependent methyltransferase [Clostridium botulinum]NFD21136.1 class I SAM-dependent methyltransferase [Clostridium botulinum]NFD25097.1 class I SAM-dependent methyltransferase [Clostridium botulinum]NFE78597.1 class I SAM-dependent methyltransferase [Clostridium botulinum]
MKNLMNKLYGQFRRPKGMMGKFIAKSMNKEHFEVTTWGLDKFKVKEDNIILDIGCGGGRTVNRLAHGVSKGKVFGMDYSLDCVNFSKKYNKDLIENGKVEIIHGSVDKMPFEDDKFDIISAVETTYFWPNLLDSFKEVRRVLKPSGKFIIVNASYTNEKFKERNEEYLRKVPGMKIYSVDYIKNLLEEVGYNNISIETLEGENWLCAIGEK